MGGQVSQVSKGSGGAYKNLGTKRFKWVRPGAKDGEHSEWLDKEREFFIWHNSEGKAGHSSLGIEYITTVSGPDGAYQEGVRYLKIEVGYEHKNVPGFTEDQLVMKYLTPMRALTLMRRYTKDPTMKFVASIRRVKNVCEDVFDSFGDYKLLTNNCKTFVEKVIQAFKRVFENQSYPSTSLTPKDMSEEETQIVYEFKKAMSFTTVPASQQTNSRGAIKDLEKLMRSKTLSAEQSAALNKHLKIEQYKCE